jgi:hypothetical protein
MYKVWEKDKFSFFVTEMQHLVLLGSIHPYEHSRISPERQKSRLLRGFRFGMHVV